MKVFLVEDSPLLRERLARQLAAIPGIEVAGHADTTQAALEGIRATAPDIVVCDIQLEEGSGFDVLRELQKTAPQIAVYVLTNFASDSYRRAAERHGARGFFDKSTEFERLGAELALRVGRK